MIPILNTKSASNTSESSFSTNKKVHVLAAIGLSIGLLGGISGCSILEPYKAPLTQGTIISQENIGLIQEGLTKAQTRQLFGPPLGQDPFNPNHWDYVYYSTDKTLHPDSVKRLSIYFDEDEMIKSWEVSDKPVEIIR
ncbi:MAG: outer membrane protein assembly factor BamE [Pseudomonadota bacterium]|nr:outer membrane protein assembly factor BamE [Pseudomonadota bacterium]